MNTLRQLSIGKQVSFTFGTLCAIILIIGGLFFFSLRTIERDNEVQQSRALDKLALIDDTAQDVGELQAGILRQILAFDNGDIRLLDQTSRDIEKTNALELARYQQFVDTGKERKLYDRVIRARKKYWERSQAVLAFGVANRDAEAVEYINSLQAPAYDEYLKAIVALTDYVEADARETAGATSRFISRVKVIGNVLAGLAILIAGATGYAVSEIGRQLKKDNRSLQDEVVERKRVERILRESEEKFRQLADNITDVFWITSPDLKTIEYISPGYELIWGKSTESLYGNRHQRMESIPEEDRERVLAVFQTLRGTESHVSVEYQIVRPDGTIRWIHDRGFQVRDAEGHLLRLTGIATDITERKQNEEALQWKSAFLEAQVNSTIDGILVVNPKGKKILQNQQLTDLLKIPRETADDPDHERQLRWVTSTIKNSGQFLERVVYLNSHPDEISRDEVELMDGTVLDRYSSPVSGGEGKYYGRIWTFRDITERKRADEALRESEERFSGAFEYAPIGVALASPEGRWLKVNRALCDFTGYSETELLARTFQDITYPEDLKATLENVGRLIAGEVQSYQAEKRYVHARGHLVSILLNVSLVRDSQEQPLYFIAQIQDITERKRLEAQSFQSQKMETVGKLTGSIAHEFNSILTAIIGQSEILRGDLPAGSPLLKNAGEIGMAADRAATLTRQLLAYGRKQFLQPKRLDLNQVIAGMEGMFHHLTGIDVKTQIIPAIGLNAVKADAGQIEQVIMNMASNASDAMPNGGKLILETANVMLDETSVERYSELKPGAYVMLSITDTGVGMSEEVKARVFEPFFTTKDIGEGTGLGLSTCDGIIKQSGGYISVYSEPARGTTFKIYLPQVEQQANIPVPPPVAPVIPRGTETILLVEDDPALREMASTLLERLGYRVLPAANGVEALKLKQERSTGHIDLLLTDVVMPHMSGTELADRMRTIYPHTGILFTSAYTENTVVHQGVLNEGLAFLQKPFTPGGLARKVREVLDRPDDLRPDTAQKASVMAEIANGANPL